MKEVITIDGMSCGHCVHAVRQALANTDGVTVESVEIGSAVVSYDPALVDHGLLVQVIEDEGYRVTGSAAPAA